MRTESVREHLYWCYANLAMAHAAVEAGDSSYGPTHYMIRNRLWSALKSGEMDVASLADDEKLKLRLPQACVYCGCCTGLSVDHLVASSRGGKNVGENMVWACRSCNSSKGVRDALVWLKSQGRFPPLLVLRRYLKLALAWFEEADGLDEPFPGSVTAPFDLSALPRPFPPPSQLVLTAAVEREP